MGVDSIKIFFFSSEKGSTLNGKNLLPHGSKFFPFRVDPFQNGARQPGLCCQKWQKIYQVYPVPLKSLDTLENKKKEKIMSKCLLKHVPSMLAKR